MDETRLITLIERLEAKLESSFSRIVDRLATLERETDSRMATLEKDMALNQRLDLKVLGGLAVGIVGVVSAIVRVDHMWTENHRMLGEKTIRIEQLEKQLAENEQLAEMRLNMERRIFALESPKRQLYTQFLKEALENSLDASGNRP